jgi:hypothetical protein
MEPTSTTIAIPINTNQQAMVFQGRGSFSFAAPAGATLAQVTLLGGGGSGGRGTKELPGGRGAPGNVLVQSHVPLDGEGTIIITGTLGHAGHDGEAGGSTSATIGALTLEAAGGRPGTMGDATGAMGDKGHPSAAAFVFQFAE